MSEYKCEHCKDTGWCTSKKEQDGSEIKAFCYCHPLVKSGKVKPLDGVYAFDRLEVNRKGVFKKKELVG